MLIRLKVRGFKNLVDLDIRFGAFTCIAGLNGVGKSNLFDAIRFLSMLASGHTLLEAVLSVRDEKGRTNDVSSIFSKVGGEVIPELSFEAHMIVPREARDMLGQNAVARTTLLKYAITLGLRSNNHISLNENPLEILEESLTYFKKSEIKSQLSFFYTKEWYESVVPRGASGTTPFITTQGRSEAYPSIDNSFEKTITLHSTKRGRPREYLAKDMIKTVLGTATSAESPTSVCAAQEMRSWQQLQFEPSALRQSDPLNAKPHLDANGSRMAATLYHLANYVWPKDKNLDSDAAYQSAANKLAELIGDIRKIEVEKDEKKELLTLYGVFSNGEKFPARSLSDGTLRFLALTILEMDPNSSGAICLEEPENGIHPNRIQDIVSLLYDIAMDTTEPVDSTNPLRQVIINTHSPIVVSNVESDDLLYARLESYTLANNQVAPGGIGAKAQLLAVSNTWRSRLGVPAAPKGNIRAYLEPIQRPTQTRIDALQKNEEGRRLVREQLELWSTPEQQDLF